jgi:hypothetical protein
MQIVQKRSGIADMQRERERLVPCTSKFCLLQAFCKVGCNVGWDGVRRCGEVRRGAGWRVRHSVVGSGNVRAT